MMTPKEYAAKNGQNCPVCGSGMINVEAGAVHHLNTLEEECFCKECESSWIDVYELKGYSHLKSMRQ